MKIRIPQRVYLTAITLSLIACNGCSTFNSGSMNLAQFMEERPIDDQLAIARLKEKRGDLNQANQSYRDIIKNNPSNPDALHRSAVLLSKQGKMDEAGKQFHEALKLNAPSAKLLNDYGYYCFLNDRPEEAETYFRKAIGLQSDFLSAWTNLGLTLGEQGNFEEARKAFQKASPSNSDVHCNMGYVYASQRMYDKAENEFNSALNEDPNHNVAIEGLLQVSQKIPGKEPRILVRTIASPNTHKEPMQSEEGSEENFPSPAKSLPAVTQISSPFIPNHQ